MTTVPAFDFSAAMRALCNDICSRHREFRHICMDDVAVTFAQTRSRTKWGLQAKLTPLRFEDGALVSERQGQKWTVQRLYVDQREMLYILTFYLPRFLNQSFDEKLVTVFHELYHISPAFDGDIRRFRGSCYVHTGSQAKYDQQMAQFAKQYVRDDAPSHLLEFLRDDFRVLMSKHAGVVGMRVTIPKLIPLPDVA